MAAKFRFFPDPDEWARLIAAAIERGDTQAVEHLRMAAVERDRQLEDYLARLEAAAAGAPGEDGSDGRMEGFIDVVAEYDAETLLAKVALSETQTRDVRNFTGFHLAPGNRIVYIALDDLTWGAVGADRTLLEPVNPTYPQMILNPSFPLGLSTADTDLIRSSYGHRSGARWTIDTDNVLGLVAGAIVVAKAGVITAYDPANLNTKLTLPTASTTSSRRSLEVFFYGGSLFQVVGDDQFQTTSWGQLYRWNASTSTWANLGAAYRNGRAFTPGRFGGAVWTINGSYLARYATDGSSSNGFFLSLPSGSDGTLWMNDTRTWAQYTATGTRLTVDATTPAFAGASGLNQSWDWRDVVGADGEMIGLARGGHGVIAPQPDLRVVTAAGQVFSWAGVLPATTAEGLPVWHSSTLHYSGRTLIVAGAVSKQAITGDPAHANIWVPRIWWVSPEGSSILWTGADEATVTLSTTTSTVPCGAGGLHWATRDGVRVLRWHVSVGAGAPVYLHEAQL